MPTAEIQPLSTFSFEEAVALWNEGFKGYMIDMTVSLDRYLARLHSEGLSPEKSLVATVDGKPVGFLLNGIRNHSGKVVAWNGGTGVTPEFRGQGIGRILVEGALQLYANEKVDYATLEAISTNTVAIALYRSCGYEAVDEVTSLQHQGKVDGAHLSTGGGPDYSFEWVTPGQVGQLPFYQTLVPWQAQWQSVHGNGGHGLIVSDSAGVPIGYALTRKQFDEQATLTSIALHQCVADPARTDDDILAFALRTAFAPLAIECRRSTHNFPKSNHTVINLLRRAGFTTFVEQLLMIRTLRGPV